MNYALECLGKILLILSFPLSIIGCHKYQQYNVGQVKLKVFQEDTGLEIGDVVLSPIKNRLKNPYKKRGVITGFEYDYSEYVNIKWDDGTEGRLRGVEITEVVRHENMR